MVNDKMLLHCDGVYFPVLVLEDNVEIVDFGPRHEQTRSTYSGSKCLVDAFSVAELDPASEADNLAAKSRVGKQKVGNSRIASKLLKANGSNRVSKRSDGRHKGKQGKKAKFVGILKKTGTKEADRECEVSDLREVQIVEGVE